jgi:Tfp pilus tip-associated adhesin PilY1
MKMKVKICLMVVLVFILFRSGVSKAADEAVLFLNVAPNALIVLDLSGSMNWTSYGGTLYSSVKQSDCKADTAYYPTSGSGHTNSCSASTDFASTRPVWGAGTCTGPFYTKQATGRVDCSRVAIAKRAIFNILNEEIILNPNTIDSNDDNKLNIRMGYLRFYGANGEDSNTNWTSGAERLVAGFGTSYSALYCGSSSSCIIDSKGASSVNDSSLSTPATGGTPLAHSLLKAKAYIENFNSSDPAKTCRQNFVILISDGSDTYGCGGNGQETQTDMYKRRKLSVRNAHKLYNASLASGNDSKTKIFVIGFGTSLPEEQRNTLNWMALAGNTFDPTTSQSVVSSGLNLSAITADSANVCTQSSSNDPGDYALSGYAFFAQTPDALVSALRQAINSIKAGTYSFSTTSIATSRVTSGNYLYAASFDLSEGEPFWKGHLRRYKIDDTTGAVSSSTSWDAGETLAAMDPGSRIMKTLSGGHVADFDTTLSYEKFGVTSANDMNAVVGYFRGESLYNKDSWKLGDIFHSNPVTIASPNAYFVDLNDLNGAYSDFLARHQRTLGNGRIIIVGANDGQLHMIDAASAAETYSFIPPNLLPKLKQVSHSDHPTSLVHQYFVDGPISAAELWVGNAGTYKSKVSGDWRTYVVFGLGRGVEDKNSGYSSGYLWSKSGTCDCVAGGTAGDCGFSAVYSSTYPNYCGYYAFDITDTASPAYLWKVSPSASDAPYFAGPWSRMAIGKVYINGGEKWVGFVGGGGYSYECTAGVYTAPKPDAALTTGQLSTAGRGFFVIDLSDGSVIWSYTATKNSVMASIPAPPSIVDTDFDGFVDTAYVGDLAGNVWKFKFCKKGETSCNSSQWSASQFFSGGSGGRPIYTVPTVARDTAGRVFVYWGTGDKQCPSIIGSTDRFLAVIDSDSSTPVTIGNLKKINNTKYNPVTETAYKGWYYQLATSEKMLADPVIYLGVTLFTAFTPSSGINPCETSGFSTLYGVNYVTGAGAFSGLQSYSLGSGMAQGPLVSNNPNTGGPDLYVPIGGNKDGKPAGPIPPPSYLIPSVKSNIMYWKDLRLR